MANTHFVSTATLSVVDGFNLDSFLNAISERAVKENDVIILEFGVEDGKIDVDLDDYVSMNNSVIVIHCDTEEVNYSSVLWDWLVEQFLDVMSSNYAQIKTVQGNNYSEADFDFFLYNKKGNVVSLDEMARFYEENVTI